MTAQVRVLPGMDGGTRLLAGFCAAAPAAVSACAVPLPADAVDSYRDLAESLAPELQGAAPVTLIAESFSGPLAILLANHHPDAVERLVLVNTFAANPFGGAGAVPWAFLGTLAPPRVMIRMLMTGGDDARAQAVHDALCALPAGVRAHRLELIAACDVRAELAALSCEVVLLRGADDALVPLACHEELRSVRPGARAVTLPGPHLLLQTHPDACWQAILGA